MAQGPPPGPKPRPQWRLQRPCPPTGRAGGLRTRKLLQDSPTGVVGVMSPWAPWNFLKVPSCGFSVSAVFSGFLSCSLRARKPGGQPQDTASRGGVVGEGSRALEDGGGPRGPERGGGAARGEGAGRAPSSSPARRGGPLPQHLPAPPVASLQLLCSPPTPRIHPPSILLTSPPR